MRIYIYIQGPEGIIESLQTKTFFILDETRPIQSPGTITTTIYNYRKLHIHIWLVVWNTFYFSIYGPAFQPPSPPPAMVMGQP